MTLHVGSKIIKHAIINNRLTKYSQKVYKRNPKGNIRIIHYYTKGDMLIQESGLIDECLVKVPKICVPSVIDGIGEVTGAQLALLEVISKIETKLCTGYSETLEEALAKKLK
jgi:hypothetical protein